MHIDYQCFGTKQIMKKKNVIKIIKNLETFLKEIQAVLLTPAMDVSR